MAALACGGSNTGTKVGEATSPAPAPAKVETYGVGEVIEVSDHTIVLNSVEFSGNVLKANFTVENKGTKDLPVSSMLSFEVKDDTGTKLEQNIFDCGPALDGTVLPGDKARGTSVGTAL